VRYIPDGGAFVDDGASGDAGAGTPDPDIDPNAPWTASALYTASYSSWAYNQEFVRHRDSEGYITLINPASVDAPDATFEVIPGLRDRQCLSFRAVNQANSFLRHSASRVFLHSVDVDNNTNLLLGDATWCPVPGLADPEAVSFQSYNYPNRYLHVRNRTELWIDDFNDSEEFAAEATFVKSVPFIGTEPAE
jgi:hypothetical protein